MKKYGVIYLIKNTKNGKSYIGQTIQNVQRRWKCHRRNNKTIISKALKNKSNDFIFIELITCFDKESLNYYEKFFINLYNTITPNGYNQTDGGNNYTFTTEVKNKMKQAKLGKTLNNHISPILAQNVLTNEIKHFDSFRDAQKELNVSRSSILKSCKYGIIRKNYLFSYANQSGSVDINKSSHAQRLEDETKQLEYNSSTSPQFPSKYIENKKQIIELYQMGFTAHAISKKLNLDKSMTCYFIHCFKGNEIVHANRNIGFTR